MDILVLPAQFRRRAGAAKHATLQRVQDIQAAKLNATDPRSPIRHRRFGPPDSRPSSGQTKVRGDDDMAGSMHGGKPSVARHDPLWANWSHQSVLHEGSPVDHPPS
jgi:hypothetical protein